MAHLLAKACTCKKEVHVCQPRVFARTAKRLAELSRLLYPNTPSLTPDEFLERSKREKWAVVDVRSDWELGVSTIPSAQSKKAFEATGAAQCGIPVLAYCMSGIRSTNYVGALREQGIEAYSLAGGLLAWTAAGGRLVTREGRPTWKVAAWGGVERALPPGYQAVEKG